MSMRWLSRLKFKAIDKSPELWFISGCVMLVGAVISSSKARCKFEEAKERKALRLDIQQDYIRECEESGETYTDKEIKKDTNKVKFDFVIDTVVAYAPTALLTVGTVFAFGKSFGILKTWYAGMASAYAGLARSNAALESSDDEPTQFDVTRSDRLFNASNKNFTGDVVKDKWWLEKKLQYCQEIIFEQEGKIFLNQIYDVLEMPQSQAGQIMGNVYYKDPEEMAKYGGTNKLSFGLDRPDAYTKDGILLRFNVEPYPILGRSGLVVT